MKASSFGQHLKQLRAAHDLTQAALASQVGCAVITLKLFESGRRRPSRQIAERLAQVLQIAPDAHEQFIRLARQAPSNRALANPYKGLAPFEEHDSDLFFGREVLLGRLITRLRSTAQEHEPRFLAIVGPSGSGKSSLVRAGLLPALRTGALAGAENWLFATLTPGAYPNNSLDLVLAQFAKVRRQTGRLLVIDQFEELFTLCVDEHERMHYLQRIMDLITIVDGQTWVVLTLRADFFDHPLRYRTFGALLCTHAEIVLPLAPAELERAICGPAEAVSTQIEAALVSTLIADVDAQPGALPLLQYVLTELFEQSDRRLLTLGAYHALGGIAGVIARRASALFAELRADEQAIMRQVFLRLVQPGASGIPTRRRVLLRELESLPLVVNIRPILEQFARYRLLTLDQDLATSAATVEIAHEVLIDEWSTLRDWLDLHHQDLLLHRQLARAADEWRDSGAEPSFLASGRRLAQYAELLHQAQIVLNAMEYDFLEASIAHDTQEQRDTQERHVRLQASLLHSEALRLAAESNRLRLAYGSAELIALLALRSIELRYTPQGDEALTSALLLDLPIRYLHGSSARIHRVAYAPDGHTIATADQDMIIRIWDAETGLESKQLIGHTSVIRVLMFSPDGVLLASISVDGVVCFWDRSTGICAKRIALPYARSEDYTLDISPDGRRLLVGSEHPEVLLWDVASGKLLQRMARPAKTFWLTFLPNGRSALIVSPVGVYCLDLETGRDSLILEQATFGRAALVSGNGMLTLAIAANANVEFWDLGTATRIATGRGHSEPIAGIVADPSGRWVATVGNDGTARVWDAATGHEHRRFVGHGNLIWSADFSPNGEMLVTGGADGVTCLWAITNAAYLENLIHYSTPIESVVYLPNGKSFITTGGDHVLRLWDATERREYRQYTGIATSIVSGCLACSPDGRVVANGSDDGSAYVWDITNAQLLLKLPAHRGRIWGVAIARDNQLLLTTGADHTARLWDMDTGTLIHVLKGHSDVVIGAAFSPDGRYALTGSDDGTVRLWDVRDGREVQRIIDPNGPMMQVDFHPDGKHILTGSADGCVRLWDIERGSVVRTFTGHQGYIYSATFSHDGTLALTCAADRTARLWDVATGQELRRLVGHTSVVFDAAISQDKTQIVTCSYDGTIRLWHTDYRAAGAALKARLLRDFTAEERHLYGFARS